MPGFRVSALLWVALSMLFKAEALDTYPADPGGDDWTFPTVTVGHFGNLYAAITQITPSPTGEVLVGGTFYDALVGDKSVQIAGIMKLNHRGEVISTFHPSTTWVNSFLVDDLGRVILPHAETLSANHAIISRVNEDGTPDPSFHTVVLPTGIFTVHLAFGPRGSFYAHTYSYNSGTGTVTLYRSDGTPDPKAPQWSAKDAQTFLSAPDGSIYLPTFLPLNVYATNFRSLAKFDKYGNLIQNFPVIPLWAQNRDFPFQPEPIPGDIHKMAIDHQGNLLIAGYFFGAGGTLELIPLPGTTPPIPIYHGMTSTESVARITSTGVDAGFTFRRSPEVFDFCLDDQDNIYLGLSVPQSGAVAFAPDGKLYRASIGGATNRMSRFFGKYNSAKPVKATLEKRPKSMLLHLTGGTRPSVLIESSSDLRSWSSFKSVTNYDGFFTTPIIATESSRFLRISEK